MTTRELIERLRPMLTDERWELLQQKIKLRTSYMTVVAQDTYHAHNASAIIRTCECMGVQNVGIISNYHHFLLSNDIARGALKWLTIHTYVGEKDNTPAAFNDLRAKGYRIVATTPHRDAVSPSEFDVEAGPFALVFGSEKRGLNDYALSNADSYIRLPMVGFTESLNLSVSVGMVVSRLRERMMERNIGIGMSADEEERVLLEWVIGSIRNGNEVVERIKCDFDK
ncbi:MAG: RNA methyltransferase [Bacteroidales bacterium]|nr:RNA methyltransferase [Bacteroidales bacterium]